jgi:hypothetical protein
MSEFLEWHTEGHSFEGHFNVIYANVGRGCGVIEGCVWEEVAPSQSVLAVFE